MLTNLPLALTLLRREWRSGDVRTLLYAATLAVMCVTTVSFFVDRIQQALVWQANELLAADSRLRADRAIKQEYIKQAQRLGLHVSQFQTFRSMIFANGKPQLAEIKVVDDNYPLRGQLLLKDSVQGVEFAKTQAPDVGTIWIDGRLRVQLGLSIGDPLQLGNAKFQVSKLIAQEPDRSADMFSIAPRAMISTADIDKTGLLQVGSLAKYYLLIAGKAQLVRQYKDIIKPQLQPGERLEGVKDARNEIRTAMKRAEQFFGLVAVVSVLLSLAAIGICARRFAERNTSISAILRCLGCKQSDLTQIYVIQLSTLGLLAGVIGGFLGWISHYVLAELMGTLFLVSLPTASWWPVLPGLLVGVLGVLMVALPPLLHLRSLSTLAVLRQEVYVVNFRRGGSYLLGLIVVCCLVFWLSADTKMAFILIGGLVATLVLLFVIAGGLLYALRYVTFGHNNAWQLGLRNLTRNPLRNITQVLAFGVAIMAILLLTMIRGDVLSLWKEGLPEDVPNQFIIGIQKNQLADIEDYIVSQGFKDLRFYPIVRARISAINGKAVSDTHSKNSELLHHEYKLSWATILQPGNDIAEGDWWQGNVTDFNQFSVEQRMAKSFGLKVGDQLSFNIADQTVVATITSLREVQWDSFKPNFYVLSPPELLENYPVSFITSLYADPKSGLIDQLVSRFPNVTIINIAAIIQQIRDITTRVTMAVEYMFFLTLITGIVLLLAVVQVSFEQRRQETAVLRILGASRGTIVQSVIAEFGFIGLLSGFVAVLFSFFTAHILAQQLFQQDYYPSLWYWFIAIIGGALGTGILGYVSLRKIINESPLQNLSAVSR